MTAKFARMIVLGTRGSELALAQAHMADTALREKCGMEVRVEVVRTSGDESNASKARVIPSAVEGSRASHLKGNATGPLGCARDDGGRKGMFTAELERALIDQRIDVAVHSAKDLPSEMESSLVIAAVLPRGAVEDVLITKDRAIRSAMTIATSSVRRQRQLQWLRNPRQIFDLRGNVPTRLRKFAESDWDAIVLARAGLERLGFSAREFEFERQTFLVEILPVAQFVPAGGQGIIALQTRVEDAAMFTSLDHGETHDCLRAEREFLRLLGGDCDTPVGAHARYVDGEMELCVQLFTDGDKPRVARARGPEQMELARLVFEKIEHEHDYEHEQE